MNWHGGGYLISILVSFLVLASAELTFDEDGNLLDDGLFKSFKTPRKDKDDKQSKMVDLDASLSLGKKDSEESVVGERVVKEDRKSRKGSSKEEREHGRRIPEADPVKGEFQSPPVGERVVSQQLSDIALADDVLRSLTSPDNKDANATSTLPEGIGGVGETTADMANNDSKLSPGLTSTVALNGLNKSDGEQAQPPSENDLAEKQEELDLYPWQSAECKDTDPEACAAFKPFCNIMGLIAFRKCTKTCQVCATDDPEAHVLGAKIEAIGASVILSQKGPNAPTFLTVCVKKETVVKLGMDKVCHGLVIHNYGEVGETCQNFGPHYNPFGTSHGHPDDSSKHAGDLGQLLFGDVPDDWPDDVPKCQSDLLLGAYGMFDHVQLFGDACPTGKPVVLYRGESPIIGFEKSTAVGCGQLSTIRGEAPQTKGSSGDVANTFSVSSDRVKETAEEKSSKEEEEKEEEEEKTSTD